MSRNKTLHDIPTLLLRNLAWLRDEIEGFKTPLEWTRGDKCQNWAQSVDLVRFNKIKNRLAAMLALIETVDGR